MKTNKLYFSIFVMIILSLIKVDYRFDEIPYGLEVDDAEYYYTAATIGIDFDLDFSNQMKGIENRYLNKEVKKIVPFHPIGAGVLASPFVFIGNFFSSISSEDNLISPVYFLYSIAPIFYLFMTLKLMQMSLEKLNITYENNLLLLMFFGTGIGYYAFDRFSMSHVYEVFGTATVIYLTILAIKEKNTSRKPGIFISIGILLFVFLSIRWVNYFLFLIPALICYINNKSPKKIYLNPYFFLGSILGFIGFIVHTKYLYGIYTLNQTNVVLYVENSFQENFSRFFDINMFFENILFVIKSSQIILFSQEFGLFYFAPIIFLSSVLIFMVLRSNKPGLSFLLFLIYIFPLFSVIVIQNTAFSYGYRYLFALIPINVLIYFKFFGKNKILQNYLYVFSLLGFILYLFFETSQATSLSSDYVVNSFGMNTRYSNPVYLSGLLSSITNIDAYLHIIFTSFLGVGFIKLMSLFINPVEFLGNYTELSSKVLNLIENSLTFSWIKLIILYMVVSLLAVTILEKNK